MRKKHDFKIFVNLKLCYLRPWLFLLAGILLIGMKQVYAQEEKTVTLNVDEQLVRSVLAQLKKMTGHIFVYKESLISKEKRVTLHFTDASLATVVAEICRQIGVRAEFDKQFILLLPDTPKTPVSSKITIRGKVTDADDNPLPGATVVQKGSVNGTVTNENGIYQLELNPKDAQSILFSFIGFKTKEVKYTGETTIQVKLEEQETNLEEVVVTGMFTRRAESFTGSATTFKREDLIQAGNQNLLRSLKNLDPSFQIVESLEFGSDPNRTPEIQLRGKTSFSNLQGDYEGNPNQPLFILDGFETTLQKVYDLDMNRVASVTLLKDAAAKAIYGSKAGNGVVVIETIQPRTGELRVTYMGDLNIEGPDLTGYNLMDASEKLSFEVSRGMYSAGADAESKQLYQELYQTNYQNVLRGVNTYWLSKPLRTGVGHKHTLTLEGGDSRMRYAGGFSYNHIGGVMKESDRKTLAFYTTLSYSYKSLLFRNNMKYTRNTANDSPYGSFSEYTVLNPYWIPYDETGKPIKLLGSYGDEKFYNPLYNASLNTKFYSNYNEIRDNFSVEWKIEQSLKVTGRFSYMRQVNGSEQFYPASHTRFADYDENEMSERKGIYTKEDGQMQSLQANVGINFSRLFGKHLFFVNGTWNISVSQSASNSYTAEGFGNDQMDNISFATQYEKDGTPSGSTSETREMGVIGALNYSFDDRYLFDASIRTTGSSMYGADKRWGMFWSLGMGWNIHKEKFMSMISWLDQLKLRTSVGYTGTQNFSPYQAKARYSYDQNVYDGKLGAILMGLPNRNLKWQRNMDYNFGLDLIAKQCFNLKFDYYISQTDDLLSDITAAPSMGFDTYKENLGKIENRGIDVSLSCTPWRNSQQRAWVTVSVSALHNKNKIEKIYDIFKSSNNKQNSNKDDAIVSYDDLNTLKSQYTDPSTLYYEGQSMTAIWGVRSAGIDPLTGKEMFYDLEGNKTYTWKSYNQVVIGDSNPKLSGNLSLNAGYKGFTLSISCSYKMGGEMYNSTLISKVENATGRENLDCRIFDSWSYVGQISPYKRSNISAANPSPDYTKPTSRFIQKDNELYISSLNIGYDFSDWKPIRDAGMQNLRLSFYMNELLRLSAVEVERGTSYPFARNYSLSLQVTF